jgi:hypothetical protein
MRKFTKSFFVSFILSGILYTISLTGNFFDYLIPEKNSDISTGMDFLSSSILTNSEIVGIHYVTTGDDPQIVRDVSAIDFKYINLHILEANQFSEAQVFWEFPNIGFSEEISIRQEIKPGNNIFHVPNKYGKVMSVRIDLTHTTGGIFNIDSVEFSNSLSFPRYSFCITLIFAMLLFLLIVEVKDYKMTHFENVKIWVLNHNFIIFYSIAIFLIYSIWSLVTPYNGAPDEHMRYKLLRYITDYGKLPVGGDPIVRDGFWGFSYAYFPYTTQIIGGFLIRILKQITFDPNYLLYIARLPSILSGVGTTIFTYKIGRKLFRLKWTIALTIFVSLWPENAMISSYINNDAFALFTISVMIYAWICGLKTNWNLKSCIGLGIGAGMCLISYYNAFIFLVLSAFIWLGTVLFKKENRKNYKKFIAYLGIMLSIAILIGGWFYIRNAVLYDGDFFGLSANRSEAESFAIEELKPSNRSTFKNDGKSMLSVLRETDWLRISFDSFIAILGSMDIKPRPIVFGIIKNILNIGLLITLINAIISITKKRVDIFLIVCAISIPSGIALSLYNSWASDYQPQGRYFLTVLIPLAILVISGYAYLEKYIRKSGIVTFILIVSGLAVAHVYSFFAIFAFYHPQQDLHL